MARCDAAETGRPRYDGKVGSAVARTMRCAASHAEALRRKRSGDDEMWFLCARGLDGAHQCKRCRAGGGGGAGGGGSARPDLALLTTFSPVFFFSRVIKSG